MRRLLTTLLFLPLLSPTTAAADECRGHRRGPPPEAFEACEGLQEGDPCVVVTPRGDEIDGSCILPPRGEDEALVCRPDNPPPRPPRDGE